MESVKALFNDGSCIEFNSIEEASVFTKLSENIIKSRCNSGKGSKSKDGILFKWSNEKTARSKTAKRNRKKGNRFELDVIKDLTNLGFKGLVSSRSQNKRLDNAKVDIAETEDALPFYIQCKATKSTPNIETIIKECPLKDKPLIIFWRKQNSILKNHDYVIMPKKVLYNLLSNE